MAAGESPDAVRLSVPSTLEYVRIVRLTASGVASRLGFDVDEIENLRVAIDELTSMAVEFSAPGALDITFATTDDELRVVGRAPVAPGVDVVIEDLTAQILKAVIDEHDLSSDGAFVTFSCSRRLPIPE